MSGATLQPTETLPFVSIIVPVWNSAASIRVCLAAIAAQTYPADRLEVLVVDNGSTDETPDAVGGFPFATLLHEPQPGSYSARNRGLASARGYYVAFTDADCVPDPTWIERTVAAAETRPNAGVIAGRIELMVANGYPATACAKFEQLFAFQQATNVERGHAATANWLSRRDLVTRLSGFDSRLRSGGDFLLAKRILAAGYRLHYAQDAVVRHPTRADLGDLIRKYRRVAGGRWTAEHSLRFARLLRWALGRMRARLIVAFRTPGLSTLDRLKIGAIVLTVYMFALGEGVRLAFGAEPIRA